MNLLKAGVRNRATTLMAIGMLMAAIGGAIVSAVNGESLDYNVLVAEVLAAVGLLLARDADTSTEASTA